jgi:SHAQKYF class myb-like DNA-binding protein
MTNNKDVINFQNETPLLSLQEQEIKNENENTVDNENKNKNENTVDNENKNKNENEDNITGQNGRWDKNEHLRFLGGCLQYGNNWKKVETFVKTRNSTQIRSHAQKYLKKLEKKYFTNSNNTTHNNNLCLKEENLTEDNTNNNNSLKNREMPNKINVEKNITQENNSINKNGQIFYLKNERVIKDDNKTKLSEEKIKRLIEELPKPDFNIEIVEKIILRIFRLNKKYENFQKNEMNLKKYEQKKKVNGNNKNNKNIFLCQKLKREINYEEKIKELLNSNNQSDLNKLFKIFDEAKDSVWYDILMRELNDN